MKNFINLYDKCEKIAILFWKKAICHRSEAEDPRGVAFEPSVIKAFRPIAKKIEHDVHKRKQEQCELESEHDELLIKKEEKQVDLMFMFSEFKSGFLEELHNSFI